MARKPRGAEQPDTQAMFGVAFVPIDTVLPYEKNSRRHPERNLTIIAESLSKFGWQQPIVVDSENVIIIGHGRHLAAKQLGMTEVPVKVASGLSEAQVKALRIADNKASETAQWDTDMLLDELDWLNAFPEELAGTGFMSDEIEGMHFMEDDSHESASGSSNTRHSGGVTGTREGAAEPGNAVIQYNIVFDTTEQRDTWYEFMRHVKEAYPDEETIAARVAAYLRDNLPHG